MQLAMLVQLEKITLLGKKPSEFVALSWPDHHGRCQPIPARGLLQDLASDFLWPFAIRDISQTVRRLICPEREFKRPKICHWVGSVLQRPSASRVMACDGPKMADKERIDAAKTE